MTTAPIAPPTDQPSIPSPTRRAATRWVAARRIAATAVTVGAGLAAGIALGVTYRVFMRLVSTSPEFTWDGTLFIIGAVTVPTTLAICCSAARRRWRRRWARGAIRWVAGVSFLGLASGPGGLTVPAFVLGGLAWGRRDWSRRRRRIVAAASVPTTIPLVWLERAAIAEVGAVRSAAALLVLVLVLGSFARLFALVTGSAPVGVATSTAVVSNRTT